MITNLQSAPTVLKSSTQVKKAPEQKDSLLSSGAKNTIGAVFGGVIGGFTADHLITSSANKGSKFAATMWQSVAKNPSPLLAEKVASLSVIGSTIVPGAAAAVTANFLADNGVEGAGLGILSGAASGALAVGLATKSWPGAVYGAITGAVAGGLSGGFIGWMNQD